MVYYNSEINVRPTFNPYQEYCNTMALQKIFFTNAINNFMIHWNFIAVDALFNLVSEGYKSSW